VHVAEYEHLDFVWAEDAGERLYAPIVEFLRDMPPEGAASASSRL
jgi:hypothetical protein